VVVEPGSHRVFAAHGDRVSVVDGQDGAVLGAVMGLPGGTHGIAFSPATGQGFTDEGESASAAAFDLKTLKPVGHIKAQDDADGIAMDPKTGHIFVVDSDPGKLTVIDPKTNTVVDTIDAGGKLEYAAADGAGMVYANGEAKREILKIDATTNKIVARFPIPKCESPHGLAVDAASQRLFASCENGLLEVVDAASGRVIKDLPIGLGSDTVAFDPVRKRVFSSNGIDGTVTVIQESGPEAFTVAATIKTAVTGKTMAVDPQTGRLFIAAGDALAAKDARGRSKTAPGSMKLLFLDPVS
jgi:YVTN family beta-propeller protein